MKYLAKPFPTNHFAVQIPMALLTVEVAFDTKEELEDYVASIPKCIIPGATAHSVTGLVSETIGVADCRSRCDLNIGDRCPNKYK